MTNALYEMAIGTFVPMMSTLSDLLDKGAEHVRANGGDPENLLEAKLAPDMFPLDRQVQFVCRQAREGVFHLIGEKPPEGAYTEMSFAELKAHIAKTIELVKSVSAARFDGAEKRVIEFPLQGGAYVSATGLEVLRDWTLPNFYFHVVTAYDILRNQGVQIGKRDYMGASFGPHIRGR